MNFEKLTEYLDSLYEHHIPGCDMAVSLDNKVVYRHCAGFNDYDRKKAVSPNDMYILYSATKVITSTAAMQLVEQGLIGLDDKLSKYIPEFEHMNVKTENGVVPAKNPITIRNLFSMTSGLTYDFNTPYLKAARENPQNGTLEIIRELAKDPLAFEPSTHYCYSLSHDVLAAVVETVSGMKYSEYLKKNIFEPVGMIETGFVHTDDIKKRLAAQYWFDYTNNCEQPTNQENSYNFTPNYESGGAGLTSSVNDYILFSSALANDGVAVNGAKIISRESIDLMRTNNLSKVPLEEFGRGKKGYGYGLGVRTLMNKQVANNSRSPIGEFGWDGAAGAYVMIDPINHISIFYDMQVLGCGYSYDVIHPTIRNLTYEALDK